MLERTFVHLPGVGPAAEKKLWQRGVATWDELRAAAPKIYKQPVRLESVLRSLDLSDEARAAGDLRFFYTTLPRPELWRLVPGNLGDAAFLDIESTGNGYPPVAESTAICVYYRGELHVEHDPARKRRLVERLQDERPLIVTFFGESFDLPFLRREFDLPLDNAHLDLCHWLKRLGFKGGLKRVQKEFPDIPQRESMDLDGYDAVRLWRLHLRGVPGALETLMTYNAEDTVVLEALAINAYNLECARRPELALTPLPSKAPPRIPTVVHHDVYRMLRGSH